MMMQTTGLTVDVVRAEPARFRHPLLLLHGLWTGNWIWRELAAHLANRGWESWAPSLLREGRAPSQHERVLELAEACRSMPAPPVIVAHDAAVTTARALARDVETPAIIALAPWVPPMSGRLGLFLDRTFRRAALFGDHVPPPEPPHALLAGIEPRVAELLPDSAAFVRAACGAVESAAGGPPGLVLVGREDPAITAAAAERLAARAGWSCDVHESQGHFPMVGRESARLADRVHRWIVRTTGKPMLLWDEDADDDG
jgi:hypothetical protein